MPISSQLKLPNMGEETLFYGHFDGVTDDKPRMEWVGAAQFILVFTGHPLVWLIDSRNSLNMKREFSWF
jgi:hypothetical protein